MHDADLTALLGRPLTDQDFLSVSAESIHPLFQYLEVADLNLVARDIRPVPVDKIQRNGFSDAQARVLTLGEAKLSLVDEYLGRVSPRPTYKSEVAGVFTAKYKELRMNFDSADEIFDKLLAWLTAGIAAESVVNAATVLAYFFSTCQIFEEESL